MHSDLRNPLLVKYKFDAKEFVQGSSEAFKQVHRAIASLSFTNFVNGYVRTCLYMRICTCLYMHICTCLRFVCSLLIFTCKLSFSYLPICQVFMLCNTNRNLSVIFCHGYRSLSYSSFLNYF